MIDRTHRGLRRSERLIRRCPIATLSNAEQSRVVVVGGGAAGFFAAISLARVAGQASSVTILEGSPTVLSKVRISGGGRCNVTSGLHHDDARAFAANYPRGSRAMPAVLSRFGAADVVRFFEDEGVALKVEPTGKIFPVSDSSETVIAALVSAAKRVGVSIHTRARVADVQYWDMNGKFDVYISGGRSVAADFVIVATGSALIPQRWAARMGHTIVPPVPSLFTFQVKDARLRELAGVAVEDCSVCLKVSKNEREVKKTRKKGRHNTGLTQRGPLLITHWGLSGPVVLTLSAFGARVLHEEKYNAIVAVDWIPSLSLEEKASQLQAARLSLAQKNIATVCPFRQKFPKRLWRYLLGSVPGLAVSQRWGSLKSEDLKRLATIVHCSQFAVVGKGEFKEEFVTAGGVALGCVNMKTFESKHCSGLYFAGEALDVDGRTGGYNLEFAWSSGYIAGTSIGRRILQSGEESALT